MEIFCLLHSFIEVPHEHDILKIKKNKDKTELKSEHLKITSKKGF